MQLLTEDAMAIVFGLSQPQPVARDVDGAFVVVGHRYDASGKPTTDQAIAPVIVGAWHGRRYVKREIGSPTG